MIKYDDEQFESLSVFFFWRGGVGVGGWGWEIVTIAQCRQLQIISKNSVYFNFLGVSYT